MSKAKKEVRFLTPKNDGKNLARSYVNRHLQEQQTRYGKFNSNVLMGMMISECNLYIIWGYEEALMLFNEAVAANSEQ